MHKRERYFAMLNDNRVIRPFEWGTEFITDHPNGDDPRDRNIRLAPTFPVLDEVRTAMAGVATCVALAAAERLTQDRASNAAPSNASGTQTTEGATR